MRLKFKVEYAFWYGSEEPDSESMEIAAKEGEDVLGLAQDALKTIFSANAFVTAKINKITLIGPICQIDEWGRITGAEQ